MRTLSEALTWYKQHEADDMLGFKLQVLLDYLPFELAKPYLKPEATAAAWHTDLHQFTPEQVIADARAYMAFAWGKVLEHRGLSAGRSVEKMQMWCYLLGEDRLVALCNNENQYAKYGAPILLAICTMFGWPVPMDDRVARMAAGKSCRDGCDEGCGRM